MTTWTTRHVPLTFKNPVVLPTTVYATKSRRPMVVNLTTHAGSLQCGSLLPELPEAVAGLWCASPSCCDASTRETYNKIRHIANRVRQWKMMVETEETISLGRRKIGPHFEDEVRRRLRLSVDAASLLWQTMYTEGQTVRPTLYELAPLGGGDPQPIDDLVTALSVDVLTMVLGHVIRYKISAGEPVGNVCSLRRTCTAFATNPIFEPFTPRLVAVESDTNNQSAFPHRPCTSKGRGVDSALATVCARRELSINLRISIPGDPRSERLLFREGGPFYTGVDLFLRLQVTHPDGSVHDLTDRFMEKRTLSHSMLRRDFRLEGLLMRARTSFQFKLLSSVVDGELRRLYTPPKASSSTLSPSVTNVSRPPRCSRVVTTVARTLLLERGETRALSRRPPKRSRSPLEVVVVEAPTAPIEPMEPKAPKESSPRPSLGVFRFSVHPHKTSDHRMLHLHWESENFVSTAV